MKTFKLFTIDNVQAIQNLTTASTADDQGASFIEPCGNMFKECAPSQSSTKGFSLNTALGEASYVTSTPAGTLLTITVQTKTPNKHTVKRLSKEKLDKIMEAQGVDSLDMLPKTVVSGIKDEALQEVLYKTDPNTPKNIEVLVRKDNMCLIGTTSEKEIQIVRDLLSQSFELDLSIFTVEDSGNLPDFLDNSVTEGLATKLTLGKKAEVYTETENKILYKGDLYSDDIIKIVKASGCVTKLELEYDGVVTAVIDDTFTFSGVKFAKSLVCQENKEDVLATTMLQMDELNNTINYVLESL